MRALDYVGAGTVEFLVDVAQNSFFFLEVNTRVQVEHPVTEMVTGVDIVREQLRIASGEALQIMQGDVRLDGHAVEFRINAESPRAGFVPSPGTLTLWRPPNGAGIRTDSHCFSGYRVPSNYDSLLAKLICYGSDRDEAFALASRALDAFTVEGVETTLPMHRALVRHQDALDQRVNTRWVEECFLRAGSANAAPRQHHPRRVRRSDRDPVRRPTLRDGQQSLWGMRIRAGMAAAVAEDMDRTGFRTVDVAGSSMFRVQHALLPRGPMAGPRPLALLLPNSKLRAGTRSNCIAKFGLTPDSLMDLWVQTLVKHGIESFWIYDCLYNMDQMRRLCQVIHDFGAEVVPAIMFGISPVHTDEWFAARVREMVSWGIVDAIYVEDAPGILSPERGATLIPRWWRPPATYRSNCTATTPSASRR